MDPSWDMLLPSHDITLAAHQAPPKPDPKDPSDWIGRSTNHPRRGREPALECWGCLASKTGSKNQEHPVNLMVHSGSMDKTSDLHDI